MPFVFGGVELLVGPPAIPVFEAAPPATPGGVVVPVPGAPGPTGPTGPAGVTVINPGSTTPPPGTPFGTIVYQRV